MRNTLKILVTKTSEWDYYDVREYESLEKCVDDIFEHEDLLVSGFEVVVSKPNSSYTPEKYMDCKYTVEIYDTWRE